MCGRYTLASHDLGLATRFATANIAEEYTGDNISPSQNIPVITCNARGERETQYMHWGWIVPWMDDLLINARRDKLASGSQAYAESFEYRRCLIPACGFYEWKKKARGQKKAEKFYFTLKSEIAYFYAGLWRICTMPAGEKIKCALIITTEPNELVEPIHDRMPAILRPEHEDLWLSATFMPDMLLSFLDSFPADQMQVQACTDTSVDIKKRDEPPSGTLSLFD